MSANSNPSNVVRLNLSKHGVSPSRKESTVTQAQFNSHLVSIHGDSLRVAAQLAVGRRANWSATGVGTTTSSTAFLEGHELFGAECFVVDLAGGLNEVLQVGAGQKVAEVHEFAMVFILDIDDAPTVLATAHLLAIDDNVLLASNDGERDNVL